MFQQRSHAPILWIVSLHAPGEGRRHSAGEEGVFTIRFIDAAPARIARQIRIRPPHNQRAALIFILVVVQPARLYRLHFPSPVDEIGVPRLRHAGNLRKLRSWYWLLSTQAAERADCTSPCNPSEPPASGIPSRGTAVVVPSAAIFSSRVINERILVIRDFAIEIRRDF